MKSRPAWKFGFFSSATSPKARSRRRRKEPRPIETLERRELFSGSPPYAADDSYSTTHDVPLNITAPGVLSNDMAYGAVTTVEDGGPSHGQLTFNSDGSFVYVPSAGFYGSDSFKYHDLSADGSKRIPTRAKPPAT